MFYKNLIGAALAACFVTGAAWAQTAYEGAVTLQYSKYSIDTAETSKGPAVILENRFNFGHVTVDLDLGRFELKDSVSSGHVITRDANLSYQHGNGIRIGVYNAKNAYDASGVKFDFSSTGVEVGHQSSTGVTIAAFAGRTNLDSVLSLAGVSGVDFKVYDVGTRFSAEVAPGTQVFGNAVRSKLSASGNEAVVTGFGIGGMFELTDGLQLLASAEKVSDDKGIANGNTFSVGASYAVDLAGRPIYLSAEMAKTNFSDNTQTTKMDRVNLGVTVPLGRTTTRKVPAGTSAKSVAQGSHTGLAAMFGLAGL